jgi:hypothetical protein
VSSGPTPDAPPPVSDPPPAADSGAADPLADLVDRLASFDPSDWERRLQELAVNLQELVANFQLPDLSGLLAPVEEQLSSFGERLDALLKEVRKIAKSGGGGSSGAGGSPAPPVPPGAGSGHGADPPPPGSPPRGSFGSVFSDIPHVGGE